MKVARAASPLSTALMFAIANDVVVPTAAINQFLKSLFTSSFFRKTSLQRNCLYATTPEIHWPFSIGTPYATHFSQTMKKAFILAAALLASVTAGRAVTVWSYDKEVGSFANPFPHFGFYALNETETLDAGVTLPFLPQLGTAYYFDSSNAASFISFLNTHTTLLQAVFGSGAFGLSEAVDHSGVDYLRYIVNSVQQDGNITYRSITVSGHTGSVPTPTPDGGATAALLGLGIAGIAFARRKLA
jgi:hypothetical protein